MEKSGRLIVLAVFIILLACKKSGEKRDTQSAKVEAQSIDSIKTKEVRFESEGVSLAGTIYEPQNSYAALVIVHGSDQVPRMTEFAQLLAKNGITVLTYDKRGVGESEGVYAGPEVGTNNISPENLNLLAKDASEAVNTLQKQIKNIPIGLIGFSQAGWIIPIAANQNPSIEYMVIFSGPTITTKEQLRFQFYTDGNTDFWENHTEAEAREHIKNDPDRYEFTDTDPKVFLDKLSIPGLWIFGEKDIQVPVKMAVKHLNALKAAGKPFDYYLFPTLGHNTAFSESNEPVDMAIQWVKREANPQNE
ncbi:alpha/beta hydrolase family protein [Algoriphagus kandeliae]|uniref:alpha/beta hydrolase family protein n=1 Tax=Algoriphagus kandeliae TaxID=2562278 RepID=UPI00192A3A97|nr:alpha/beta hydrolase [Algoriphagus kandeliae]